jgi:hypothetical protein
MVEHHKKDEGDFGRMETHERTEAAGHKRRGRSLAEAPEVPPAELMTNVVKSKGSPTEASGIIRTVGTAALTLVSGPSPDSPRQSIVIPSESAVTLNGKAVNLWDLKAGDQVDVTTQESKDRKDKDGNPTTVATVKATRKE